MQPPNGLLALRLPRPVAAAFVAGAGLAGLRGVRSATGSRYCVAALVEHCAEQGTVPAWRALGLAQALQAAPTLCMPKGATNGVRPGRRGPGRPVALWWAPLVGLRGTKLDGSDRR